MKKSVVSVIFLFFAFSAFAQDYADLYGKQVEIHGPKGYKYLAVAMTEHSYNMLKA